MATGFTNVAELHATVGGVPLERIRLIPHPGEATLADAIGLAERGELNCELVDGILIEKAMGYQESLIAMTLGRILGNFIADKNQGIVAGPDGFTEFGFGCVRAPDVSFVSWDRLPVEGVPHSAVPELVPDLAVEILSTSNTDAEMQRKVADFKRGGVRTIWLLDPRAETATLYLGDAEPVVVGADAALDTGGVLPGFELTLAQLLEKAGVRRKA